MRPHFQSPIFGFFGREYHEDILFFSLAHQQEPTYNKEENSTLYLFHHPRFFSLSKLFVFLKKSFQSVFFFSRHMNLYVGKCVMYVGIHSIKCCLTKTPQHFRTVKRTKEKKQKTAMIQVTASL